MGGLVFIFIEFFFYFDREIYRYRGVFIYEDFLFTDKIDDVICLNSYYLIYM